MHDAPPSRIARGTAGVSRFEIPLDTLNPCPPLGLVNPVVAIAENGSALVTHVTPPPGLINPTRVIDEQGNYLFGISVPALSQLGMATMVMLLLVLGGYFLGRRRAAQDS
jgi:hypothetical protein